LGISLSLIFLVITLGENQWFFVFFFGFHFFDIQIIAKFNQKIQKLVLLPLEKKTKKKSKNFSISFSKNIEILPGKKKKKNIGLNPALIRG
jgi:hypothetical protein